MTIESPIYNRTLITTRPKEIRSTKSSMDLLPIDVVMYISSFLPIMDKLHLIQTCHRFYHSTSLSKIVKTVASYHPQNATPFELACRAGEEHFVDIHLSRSYQYVTAEMALVYSARFGHLHLFKKYLPKVKLTSRYQWTHESSLIEIITDSVLHHERSDLFEALLSYLPEEYNWDTSFLLERLLPLPSNKVVYEMLTSTQVISKENILTAVEECYMNPYTAIYFDPNLKAEVLSIEDRRPFCRPAVGPIVIDDELVFAYLSRDYRILVTLIKRIIADKTTLRHHHEIIKASATTHDAKCLAHAIKLFGVHWDEDITLVLDLHDNIIPVIATELSKFIDSNNYEGTDQTIIEDDEVAHATFIIHSPGLDDILRIADEMGLPTLIIQLAEKHPNNQEALTHLMKCAFSKMLVEAIEVLHDIYHVPLPTEFGDNPTSFFSAHRSSRYIHPRMVDLLFEGGLSSQQIKAILKEVDRMYLWDIHKKRPPRRMGIPNVVSGEKIPK